MIGTIDRIHQGEGPNLFSLPPHSNPTTSREAAEAIAPSVEILREQVRQYLKSQGEEGATDLEIQAALGMIGDTERPRRDELVKSFEVRNSGKRRKTKSGRSAIVWVYGPKAFEGGSVEGQLELIIG